MTRALSLLTPSGRLTLGNLLGALRPMAAAQDDAFYGVSDLHAMTTDPRPGLLRAHADETAALLLAVGLDRSHAVPAEPGARARRSSPTCSSAPPHTGELNRMIQFKEKGRGRRTPPGSRSTPTRR